MDLERAKLKQTAVAVRERERQASELPATENRLVTRLEPAGLALRRQMDAIGVRLPPSLRSDLMLVSRSVETQLAMTILGAGLGVVFPLLYAGLLTALIPGLPASTPFFLALIGLVVGGLLPTAQLSSKAKVRRRDFRHVVGSFLDLVALNLSGGRGVPEALTSAASISDGWAMVQIRDCLEIARLQGVTPWAALGELGNQAGVTELRDLAAALELVADDGAKVRESLAARAASLRRRELADAEGRAQARSQSMLVAQLLLAVGFLIFLIYPAIVRVLGA
jgi:Flp pilus assembly protein TadB